jgi:hypothetical protein
LAYLSLSKPKITCDPLIMIGRRMRLGLSIIIAIASLFDFGRPRSLNTGLRVLT